MKKINFLAVLLVLFSAFNFTSCDTEPVDPVLKDGFDDDGGGVTSGVFKVNIDGETRTATAATAVVQSNVITIVGLLSSSGEMVNIVLPGVAVGSYTNAQMSYLPGTGGTQNAYANVNDDVETNGNVIITNINTTAKTISGTFRFTGYPIDTESGLPIIEFTNGTFQNVPYTGTIPGTNPGPTPTDEEYYKAKVNGTMVNFDEIQILGSGGYMTLMGLSGNNLETIQLRIDETLGPDTYAITDGVLVDVSADYSTNDTSITATEGTLTIISKENGWIKGTFSFSGTDENDETIQITEGSFNIEYEW
ncbi:DUF6252 family protein [Flavobacterium sp. MK4S-17]|uniref:DUF6252 family protein n=1 Tax=Flavobacterium sp. MK4S-17 TaxID=2543737 RepID=UPI0013586010|nr:DUF6252 family protein [Flavobacterium sp. MK4S-17]